MLPSNLRQCGGCGKLIEVEHGRRLCRRCAEAYDAADTAPSPVDAMEARRLEQEMRMKEFMRADLSDYFPNAEATPLPTGDTPCTRCGERAALQGSEFCLYCQINLLHTISTARNEVGAEVQRPAQRHYGQRDIEDSLNEKRERAATRRLKISPPSVKRYG